MIKKKDVIFPKIFWLFCGFIFACGFVHLLEATLFWHPWYRLSGIVKFLTASISWVTVFALIPTLPKALKLPGLEKLSRELQKSNQSLVEENLERRKTETRLKKAHQDLQQKTEEVEQFVYTVSHDLKAPMVTTSGFLDILDEYLAEGKIEEARAVSLRLKKANQRLTSLIEDLLKLNRVGSLELNLQAVDTQAMVEEIIETNLGFQIKTIGAEVRFQNLPTIEADKIRLHNILENLIGNTLKYSHESRKCVIEIGCHEKTDAYYFYVKDNGIGIAPQYQEQIFKLFVRLNPNIQGTGVGLSIVKTAIEKHHGKIWVESEPDFHTIFWFSIPKDLGRILEESEKTDAQEE